LRVTQIDTD